MKEYIEDIRSIVEHGVWIPNERTGMDCLTVPIMVREYDGNGPCPIPTTRKVNYKMGVAELLGYIRGVISAADMRKLGTKSWDANANVTKAWLENPNREGEDHLGVIYGAVGNHWPVINNGADGYPHVTGHIDLLDKIYNNLRQGIDDRGEIWSFWNPGMFQLGCLRPCMFQHHFSLIGDTLHLTSYQRSVDTLLGRAHNPFQCYLLLHLMAQITGHKVGKVTHIMVNNHIYRNQYDILMESGQLDREPLPLPVLEINPDIKTLEDLRTWVTVDDFAIKGYQHHDPIKYPFAE